MTDPKDLANEILSSHRQFKETCKQSHLASRDAVYSLYETWRSSPQGVAWRADFLRQCGSRCPECNQYLTDYNCTIDHKLPRSKYPWLGWSESNLWLLCRRCNKAKTNNDWSVYVEIVRNQRGQAAYERVIRYSPGC